MKDVTIVIVSLLCCGAGVVDSQLWSYGNTAWPGLCAYGRQQSPIDIEPHTARPTCSLGPLLWTGVDVPTYRMFAVNSGNGVNFVPQTLSRAVAGAAGDVQPVTLSGGGLPHKYDLVGVHFHWSQDEHAGSEHTINGLAYGGEMHFVHKRSGNCTVPAKCSENEFAVLAVWLDAPAAANDNVHFKPFEWPLQRLEQAGNASLTVADFRSVLRLSSLVPNVPFAMHRFYRYTGSFTTPPCTESVVWTVLAERLAISRRQMDLLRAVKSDKMAPIDAYRPTKPINTRVVEMAFEPEKCRPEFC